MRESTPGTITERDPAPAIVSAWTLWQEKRRKLLTNPAYLAYKPIRITVVVAFLAFGIALFGAVFTFAEAVIQLFGGRLLAFAERAIFLMVAMLLSYGTLTYLLARIGYYRRLGTHSDANSEQAENLQPGETQPTITVLVPSYCEDVSVVRKTLLSAVLQGYPNLAVVLLIDDPPNPTQPSEIESLGALRRLPQDLRAMIRIPAAECRAAMNRYTCRANDGQLDPAGEAIMLAALNDRVAWWFENWAERHPQTDYTDRFFVTLVFKDAADGYRKRAKEWRNYAMPSSPNFGNDDMFGHEYRRLTSLFDVAISCFERKRYINLPSAANKAANLNSYIGLLGGHHREVQSSAGVSIELATPADADLAIPDSDYVLILDADTVIAHQYAQRMVGCLRGRGNERIAVAQCPYTAFPEPPAGLQRIAGAQTDIQFLLHQGMAYYDAAYWVGANALVRTSALRQIATVEIERGFQVTKFIQDRTPIEDTESSLDLILDGWQIYNYPERLAFSATPADFGSLVIQRRRWANGGLLLLPKLMQYMRIEGHRWSKVKEVFMRAHYLISLGPVSIALLFIILFSFKLTVTTYCIFAIALIYFAFYARDLYLNGYRRSDLLRVYALNLLLVPVNFGGLVLSIRQAFTGRRPYFGRTPKSDFRTAVAPGYVIAEFLGLLVLLSLSLRDFTHDFPVHGVFLALHAVFFLYAIKAYIGFRAAFEDVFAGWRKKRLP